jgi:ATP-dependent helicase/nuclease subunit A
VTQQLFDFGRPPTPSRRNVVIEAGAGTGKTTAIVAEVLKLMLEREDLDPERIVLMTFTEKAAAEIAERIRSALEELADDPASWPVGSPNPLVTIQDRERARRAIAHHLAEIDSLRSQTIHSFCQSLLRTFPIEAALDPQFKIIEGFERSLLYGQIYDAWLDAETRVDPQREHVEQWELLFAHVGYLFAIKDLVLSLMNRRDLLAETDYDFGDFARDVEPQLTDAVIWIRRDAAPCKDEAALRVAEYLRSKSFAGGSMEAWIDYLQPIAASIRDIKLPGCGPLTEPMKVLRTPMAGSSIYDRLVSHRAALALLAMTRRFIDYLDAEKHRLGVVDFDDLLLRTLALLDDPAVLARARSQFDSIFVDEFQDTDRTQARIVDRLARDASGAFVPGKTIVVGDPKQSIYGFRRADPETYYQTTEALIAGGAERRVLTEQYRSDPALLEQVNRMFARLFPEQLHDPNVFRPAYHELRAARTGGANDAGSRITLLQSTAAGKDDRWTAEAEVIAHWIRANGGGDLRRFAILFRRMTKLDDYLAVFDRVGIPYVLPPTKSFLDRRAPVDLLAVLRAIGYAFDRGAQISAARTPYFALTDEEIAEGVLAGSGSWQSFQYAIGRFREASRHLTVSQLIDHVVDTCGIAGVYRAATDGERDLLYLEHVRSLAFEYDQRMGGSVRQFVDEITRRRTEPEENEPSVVDESQNAVRIMTVHGAKGLEFETVILPDLSTAVSGDTRTELFTVEEPRSLVLTGRAETFSANFRMTAGGEPLRKVSSDRDEAETRRLFYVGVTRAKRNVVVVCSPEAHKAGFLKCLLEGLGIEKKTFETMWPEEGREEKDTAIGPVWFEHGVAETGRAGSRRRLADPELESRLAAADLAAIEIASPAPVVSTLTAGEVAARRGGSRNRAAGILLHRALELWDGVSEPEKLLEQLATEAAAEPEALLRVRKRMATIARSPLLRRIAAAETVGRELPVRFLQDGVVVQRRIDRLIRENGNDVVIDYKSGAADEARVARDREQVARYCRAVSAITGRPCSGLLWYIDLENDQVVEV